MPKYDYKCKMCGLVEEAIVPSYKSRKVVRCTRCDDKMERLFSPKGTSFQIRWGKPKIRAKVKKMGV